MAKAKNSGTELGKISAGTDGLSSGFAKKTVRDKASSPQSEKSDFFVVPSAGETRKITPKANNRNIAISVAKNPLDAYRSPFLLDLSKAKFIEKTVPSANGSSVLAEFDFPGAELLHKFHFFDLLDLEKSEFLSSLKSISTQIGICGRRLFGRVDLSPKLPLIPDKSSNPLLDDWREISVINLFVFLGEIFYRLFAAASGLFGYAVEPFGFGQRNHDDEEIDFNRRELSAILSAEEVLPIEKFNAPTEKLDILPAAEPPITSLQKPKISLLAEPSVSRFSRWRVPLKPSLKPSLKPLLAFVGLCLLVILPIKGFDYWQEIKSAKGEVLGQTEEALGNLQSASEELKFFNFSSAKDYLSQANENFVSAQDQLEQIKSFLTVVAETLPLGNTFKSGKNLLDLGDHLSLAGENLLSGLEALNLNDESDEYPLTDKIKAFGEYSRAAQTELEQAQENFDNIKIKNLPADKQLQFAALGEKLPFFISSLKELNDSIDFALDFLGDDGLKRYLLVFQNDNELRATGGFMGSFALIDFKSGDIDKITIPPGGTYDVRAGLSELLAAPPALQLINPRWEFQDANWWPDWPTSAEKIAWFYNKSGGPTIDGVVAINSDWLGELLAATGDIELPEYGKTITAANFENEIQQEVEIDYDEKTRPKKILGDLAPKLIERIFAAAPEEFLGLFASVGKGLSDKDILLYSFDEKAQEFIAGNNWDGAMKDAPKDYFSLVATNIGGGKTDNVISQKIYHQASIAADGSVIDSVIVSRSHIGPVDETFTVQPNRSYLRFYVPLGSELIKAVGFNQPAEKEFKTPDNFLRQDEQLAGEYQAEIDPDSQTKIYQENGKTVFANWLTIVPGESRDILLVYKLPFKLSWNAEQKNNNLLGKIFSAFLPKYGYDSYSLLFQAQAGGDSEFHLKAVYPEDLEQQAVYPATAEAAAGQNSASFIAQSAGDSLYFVGLRTKLNK